MGRRRQGARDGARAQREAAGGRRDAREHRRVVRAQRARLRQGGQQGQLRRRRLRARGAGDSGGAAAQGELAEAGDGAVSRRPRICSATCAGDADVERKAGDRRQPRRGVRQRRTGHRGRVRRAVPGAHVDRPGPCDGRSVERSDDDLLERHEVVRAAQRRRAVPQDAARSRARGLDGRAAGVRANAPRTMPGSRRRFWRRRSDGRCACSGCGRKKRRGIRRGRRSPSRCAAGSTRRATSSRSTTRRAPPITIISATTSPTRC